MITALEAKELLDNGIFPVVIMPSQNNSSSSSFSIVDNNTKSAIADPIINSSYYNDVVYIIGYDMADENTISQFGTNQGFVFYVNQAGELTVYSSTNNGGAAVA